MGRIQSSVDMSHSDIPVGNNRHILMEEETVGIRGSHEDEQRRRCWGERGRRDELEGHFPKEVKPSQEQESTGIEQISGNEA